MFMLHAQGIQNIYLEGVFPEMDEPTPKPCTHFWVPVKTVSDFNQARQVTTTNVIKVFCPNCREVVEA